MVPGLGMVTVTGMAPDTLRDTDPDTNTGMDPVFVPDSGMKHKRINPLSFQWVFYFHKNKTKKIPQLLREVRTVKMDEINFLKYFFEEEKDDHAIETITEYIKMIKESSDKEDTKSYIRDLFSLVANFWYLKNTEKSWDELYDSGYLQYDAYAWSAGLTGDEWRKDDIINIIQSAILEADFYLRNE